MSGCDLADTIAHEVDHLLGVDDIAAAEQACGPLADTSPSRPERNEGG